MYLLIYHRLVDQRARDSIVRLANEHAATHPLALPDGSVVVELADEAHFQRFAGGIDALGGLARRIRSVGYSDFIFPQGERGYLWLDWDYFERLGEPGFVIETGRPDGWPRPRLDALRLGVKCRRASISGLQQTFPVRLARWLRQVADGGALGEGPVFCRNREIIVWDKRLDFELDWSVSGPFTLMWLCMEILEYGHTETPVFGLAMESEDDRFLDYMSSLSPRAGLSIEASRERLRARYRGELRGSVELPSLPW
jgi:hypothetical protein